MKRVIGDHSWPRHTRKYVGDVLFEGMMSKAEKRKEKRKRLEELREKEKRYIGTLKQLRNFERIVERSYRNMNNEYELLFSLLSFLRQPRPPSYRAYRKKA